VDVLAGTFRAAVNVYFHTFGCRANQYDTEQVRRAFESAGAAVVDDPVLADLTVINSCTVTSESEVKLRRFVRHVAKTGGGRAQSVVMGCAAALDDGAIAALPGVRAVVPNADPMDANHAARRRSPLKICVCDRQVHVEIRIFDKVFAPRTPHAADFAFRTLHSVQSIIESA